MRLEFEALEELKQWGGSQPYFRRVILRTEGFKRSRDAEDSPGLLSPKCNFQY